MPSPTPPFALRLTGGLGTSAQLVAAGVTVHAVRRAVDTGDILRLRRGFYAVPDAPASGVAAVRASARLAGLSAAASFGLWGGWSTPLHLCVQENASRVRGRSSLAQRGIRIIDGQAAVLHWNDDRHDTKWCWRVSALRSIRQVLRWHDPETALAVIDTALTQKLLATADLDSLLTGPTRVRPADILLCRAGVQSGVESLARQRLERLGLSLRLQAEVPGVGHVDIGIRGTMVYVEVDGYEFHKSQVQFDEDRRRDAEARKRGFTPMRFSAVQVRDEWPWVETMILAALAHERA